MKYKLNILEPWESGTESAINATIVKEIGPQFLLFVEIIIKVRGENAQYFVCKFENEENKKAFKNKFKGVYPIRMVFDKNIQGTESELPPLNSYRSNFISGEIII